MRDFYKELTECNFKPSTYEIYNKLYDEFFIEKLLVKYNEVFSIDDIEYYDFPLNEKEKGLMTFYNKEFNTCIESLYDKLQGLSEVKVYLNREIGLFRVVKLKSFDINDLRIQRCNGRPYFTS